VRGVRVGHATDQTKALERTAKVPSASADLDYSPHGRQVAHDAASGGTVLPADKPPVNVCSVGH
jgi:hypothetical protein